MQLKHYQSLSQLQCVLLVYQIWRKSIHEKVVSWLKVKLLNRYEEEKKKNIKILDNFQKRISQKLLSQFPLNLVYRVVYMESIKYVNVIEIDPVVWGVENGDLVVPVNNTLVCHTTFLAADTQLCVLIVAIKVLAILIIYFVVKNIFVGTGKPQELFSRTFSEMK